MPQVGDFWEGFKSTEFVLVVDGVESPGVTRVTGLSEGEYDTIEQPDGGSNHVHKISSTKVKFESLFLYRLFFCSLGRLRRKDRNGNPDPRLSAD